MSTESSGAEKVSAHVQRERYRTTIEFWHTDGGWRATEPGGESDLVGDGEYPEAAVADYCARVAVHQGRPEADDG